MSGRKGSGACTRFLHIFHVENPNDRCFFFFAKTSKEQQQQQHTSIFVCLISTMSEFADVFGAPSVEDAAAVAARADPTVAEAREAATAFRRQGLRERTRNVDEEIFMNERPGGVTAGRTAAGHPVGSVAEMRARNEQILAHMDHEDAMEEEDHAVAMEQEDHEEEQDEEAEELVVDDIDSDLDVGESDDDSDNDDINNEEDGDAEDAENDEITNDQIVDAIVAPTTRTTYFDDSYKYFVWCLQKQEELVTEYAMTRFTEISLQTEGVQPPRRKERQIHEGFQAMMRDAPDNPVFHLEVITAEGFMNYIRSLRHTKTGERLSKSAYGNKRSALADIFRWHLGSGGDMPEHLRNDLKGLYRGFYRIITQSKAQSGTSN